MLVLCAAADCVRCLQLLLSAAVGHFCLLMFLVLYAQCCILLITSLQATHTHVQTYPPEQASPSAAGRIPRPAHTGRGGMGEGQGVS